MFTIPYTVTTICPFCGMPHDVEVDFLDFCAWQNGALAQDAFPYLSADEREMLISGICPDCWERTFGGYEEDEEDYETADDAMAQIAIDEAAKVFGGEEPMGILDDYAIECMEHANDCDQSVEIFEGSAEDIFHLLFGEEAQW